jgi:hypothetical protein
MPIEGKHWLTALKEATTPESLKEVALSNTKGIAVMNDHVIRHRAWSGYNPLCSALEVYKMTIGEPKKCIIFDHGAGDGAFSKMVQAQNKYATVENIDIAEIDSNGWATSGLLYCCFERFFFVKLCAH